MRRRANRCSLSHSLPHTQYTLPPPLGKPSALWVRKSKTFPERWACFSLRDGVNLGIISLFALVAETCISHSQTSHPYCPAWHLAPRPAGRTCGYLVHPGQFPRAEGQGRTVKGAVRFLAKLSLLNLPGEIFAILAEPLPKAYNNHQLLTIYHKSGMGKTRYVLLPLNLQ